MSGYSFLTKSMFLHASIKHWNLNLCLTFLGQHILCGLNSIFSSDFSKYHNYDYIYNINIYIYINDYLLINYIINTLLFQ